MSQHMDALKLANEMRLAQTAFKTYIRGMGWIEAREALANEILDPSPAVAAMYLHKLLDGLPRGGPWQTERVLEQVGLRNTNRRLRELTERQRNVLADAVRESLPTSKQRRAA
jgi:hypothetical protein